MIPERDLFINIMNEREWLYEFYLYCNPYLLVLEDDTIIDANLLKSESSIKEDILVVETDDMFFSENLCRIQDKDFFLVLQCYDKNENFTQQIELMGEEFEVENNKYTFKFSQMSTNHVTPSINPRWYEVIDLYKKERVSYIRNSKIESILI
jgi:hypothetical protein